MKFLLDMPVSPRIVEWLNGRGHDAVHASAVGLDRAADRVRRRCEMRPGPPRRKSKWSYRLLAIASLAIDGFVLWVMWGHPTFFLLVVLVVPFVVLALLLLAGALPGV